MFFYLSEFDVSMLPEQVMNVNHPVIVGLVVSGFIMVVASFGIEALGHNLAGGLLAVYGLFLMGLGVTALIILVAVKEVARGFRDRTPRV